MMLTIEQLNIRGLSPDENAQAAMRLENILISWEGTPYLSGCQSRQQGVDCVRFVSGVLDELRGECTSLDRLPQDASFHAKQLCENAMREFLSRYPHISVEDGRLQPGDVLIAGPIGGGPGHALIAGSKSLWHCDSMSVVRTGLSFSTGGVYFLKKVFRMTDRERWV